MIDLALAVLSEIVDGVLRFGRDALGEGEAEDGEDEGGAPTVPSAHPYGLRSRTRDADVDDDGRRTNGAPLLVFGLGGADDHSVPTQDPRVPLVDEGKGGTQVYGWTGAAVPYLAFFGEGATGGEAKGLVRLSVPSSSGTTTIEIDPSSGNVRIQVAAGAKIILDGDTQAGAAGGEPLVKEPAMVAAWTTLQGVITSLGKTLPALAGAGTTKVKGT